MLFILKLGEPLQQKRYLCPELKADSLAVFKVLFQFSVSLCFARTGNECQNRNGIFSVNLRFHEQICSCARECGVS